MPALLAFQDSQPYCSLLYRRTKQLFHQLQRRVTARCHLSLALRVLVPAASDSRVSSAATFPCALTAWAWVVCVRLVIPCSSFSTITSTLCVSVSGSLLLLLAAAGLDWVSRPPPVASRSAAVDNPHSVPKTRPRPYPLFCDLGHLVHTCAYPHRDTLGTVVARPDRYLSTTKHFHASLDSCVTLPQTNPTTASRPHSAHKCAPKELVACGLALVI